MPPRQVWLFRVGCWVAIGVAVLQVLAHVIGILQPSNDIERQLVTLATEVPFAFPFGVSRTMMQVLAGSWLSFTVVLATLGTAGLVVAKRGHQDPFLVGGVARAFAIGGAALMALSLIDFFLVPTMCLALMTLCFALAGVENPLVTAMREGRLPDEPVLEERVVVGVPVAVHVPATSPSPATLPAVPASAEPPE